jgi:hypothetical protein
MKPKHTRLIVSILAVVAILVYVALQSRNTQLPAKEVVVTTVPDIEGNRNDLVSFSVSPGQEVSGKMMVTGSVRGAYFFEANIGVNILDANKKMLKQGYGTATSEWMTVDPVSFTAEIDFTNIPKGKAYIEIHNDNASGLPEHDKNILIPVVVKAY